VVGGWEASVSHREFIGQATLDAKLAYKRGTGAFGSLPAPEEAFGEGTSRFALVTADVNLSAPFNVGSQKLKYSGTWRSQLQRTPLTPQDRFSIGGRFSVRGFDGEGSLSAERGYYIRNEISAPLGQSGQEAYWGLDYGHVSGPGSENLLGRNLAGTALGLRGNLQGLQYELFLATPVHKPDGFRTASKTYGFNMNYSF
jgi:hemolysin activation/secretion protein